jgi:hypothetical protein
LLKSVDFSAYASALKTTAKEQRTGRRSLAAVTEATAEETFAGHY